MTTPLTRVEQAWQLLESLSDPEIPVVTLRELGILRDVREGAEGLEVVITPTYSAVSYTHLTLPTNREV